MEWHVIMYDCIFRMDISVLFKKNGGVCVCVNSVPTFIAAKELNVYKVNLIIFYNIRYIQ